MYLKYILTAIMLVSGQDVAAEAMTWYRDPEIKVSFAYSDKFKPEEPAEQSTRFLVSWRTKVSGGLMASCYLKAFPTVGTDADARLQLKLNPDAYIKRNIDFSNTTGKTASLVTQKSIVIDGLEGLYYVVHFEVESFDKTVSADVHHLVTFWDRHQVALICGTSLAYDLDGQASEEQLKRVISSVENEIKRVLRTLHFDRN